jgi:predicted DsbA family dithiol-disulfide isomerase
MRLLSLPLVSLALLGLFSLGASCNRGQEKKGGQSVEARGAEAKSAKIDKLERVDTSALTDAERATFVELVNELLSPCGDPVSVAQCVAEARGCGACIPSARYTARLVAEGYEKAEIQELFSARFDLKKKVDIDLAQAPVKGPPMAKLSIVEFSDFECPHCGAAHPVLARLLEEFPGKVNVAFKHFPLDSHKNAAPAARAAVAAQLQGKFWEMADKLFERQRELSPEVIRELAKEVGLDLAKFDADVANPSTQQRVDRDKKEGVALGIQGTPSLYINGRAYKEGLPSLSKYLKEALEL